MRFPIALKPFSQGSKPTCELPLGSVLLDVLLNFTTGGVNMTVAQMKAWVKNLRVKLNNGKIVWDIRKTDYLMAANGINGAQYATVDGYLRLFFAEPWRRTIEGEDFPGLGTGDLSAAIIEIEWDDAAVNPAVSGKVYVDSGPNRSAFALPIRKFRHLNFTPAGAGLFQLDKIDQGPDLFYTRFHFFSALVTSARLTIDRTVAYEDLSLAEVAEILRNRGMVAQANTYSLVFDITQRYQDKLQTFYAKNGSYGGKIQDFRVHANATGAGAIDVLVEEYSFLES